jgi:hypothetical protein
MTTKAKADKELVKECLDELGEALERFGTYSFGDKGPSDVMDIYSLVKKFKKLDPETAGLTICKLAKSKKYQGRPEYVASEILCSLQEWDELWEAVPEVSEYL